MSNSSLTLYWGTPLTPARNLKVDDITAFLSSYTSKTFAKYQYIKHALDIEIKVDLSQGQQDLWQVPLTPSRSKLNFINYLSITNSNATTGANELPVYYFVLKVTPRAEKTIALTCHMDVINTYQGGAPYGYELSDRTIIHRQHVDRFKWNEDEDTLLPIIDYVDEGVNPILFKTSEENYPHVIGGCWNLIWRNEDSIKENAFNEINPVTAWLVPDKKVDVKYRATNATYSPTDFTTGYTFIDNRNPSYVSVDGSPSYEMTYNGQFQYLIIHRAGATMDITLYSYVIGNRNNLNNYVAYATFTGATSISFETTRPFIYGYYSASAITTYPTTFPVTLANTATTTEAVKSIWDIDRKDSKLIKIISLPYPPNELTLDSGNVSFEENWAYDHGDGVFKLQVQNPTFDYIYNNDSVGNPFEPLLGTEESFDPASDRYLEDPKLYHSAFYKPKFVYDSFSFEFSFELMNADAWRSQYGSRSGFALRYIVSTTFNSKFAFMFPEYILSMSMSDYDNVLPIARNNELPIFSSQYANYIKTGYNYDVKNVNRAKTGAVLQGLAGIGTAISSALGGNPLGFGAGVFGVINAVQGAQRAEDGLKAKLAQLENQAVSISQADDIDLLKSYSGNMAKFVRYEVSPKMKTALDNLFYYCGYAQETAGIPNETSRIWFNFVQAELEFKNPKDTPTWALDEIKNRYAVGVTILHKYNGEYDPDQTKENWEVSLIINYE